MSDFVAENPKIYLLQNDCNCVVWATGHFRTSGVIVKRGINCTIALATIAWLLASVAGHALHECSGTCHHEHAEQKTWDRHSGCSEHCPHHLPARSPEPQQNSDPNPSHDAEDCAICGVLAQAVVPTAPIPPIASGLRNEFSAVAQKISLESTSCSTSSPRGPPLRIV